jgi:hypothetical protein
MADAGWHAVLGIGATREQRADGERGGESDSDAGHVMFHLSFVVSGGMSRHAMARPS